MSDVLFSSGNITVTRSVVKIGNATYPIANIGSVISEREPRSAAGYLVITGIIAGVWVGIKLGWIIGLIAFAVLLVLASRVPDKVKLTLKTSSGDVNALSSTDVKLVQNVREAIESAFTKQRVTS